MPTHQGTNGADTLELGEDYVVNSGGGNDHVTVGSNSKVFADAGDDTLVAAGNNIELQGGAGRDTYIVDWTGELPQGAYGYFTRIDEGITWETVDDTIDLSRVASRIDQIWISGYPGRDMQIEVFDAQGDHLGFVSVDYSLYPTSTTIEKIVIGSTTYDISGAQSGIEANSIIRFGVGSGSDIIEIGRDNSAVTGMRGGDTITSSGYTNIDLYGGGESDSITASLDGQTLAIDEFPTQYYLGDMNLYGEDGNDTLTVNGMNGRLDGGDGNDLLHADGLGNVLIGGAGNDTLSMENYSRVHLYGDEGDDLFLLGQTEEAGFEVTISRGEYTTGRDILDISALTDSLDNLRFHQEYGSSVRMEILDDDGNTLGSVMLWDLLYFSEGRSPIEVLRIDGTDHEIPTGVGLGDLVGAVRYGADDGDDRIEVTIADDAVSGLAGNDTLNTELDNISLDGGEGNDFLTITGDDGTFISGAGDDTLAALGSRAYVFAETGNNHVISNGTGNWIYTHDGNDTIDVQGGTANVETGTGDDLISAEEGASLYLDAGTGNDTVTMAGTGRVYGNDGNDKLSASYGEVTLYGDAGSDTLYGGSANDLLTGGKDDDVIRPGDGDDVASGGDGNDTMFAGGNGDDTVRGDDGNDIIGGAEGDDLLIGDGSSDDPVFRYPSFNATGSDKIFGGAGDDTIVGASWSDNSDGIVVLSEIVTSDADGRDTIWAGDGADMVYGGDARDILGGGSGNDEIYGFDGNDVIFGGPGTSDTSADTLDGGAGHDKVFGGAGADSVAGSSGNDTLYGGDDDDVVSGGAGNDRLYGGTGNDTLTGGEGADTFAFSSGHGGDVVMDFDTANDSLILANTVTDFVSRFEVQAAATAVTIDGLSGVLIDTGGGDSIFLVGTTIADLAAINYSL